MQTHHGLMYAEHARTARFARRVEQARDVVDRFLSVVQAPYVGFSGGKDSTALLGLLSEMGQTDVPVFTQADDLDWPEKQQFCVDTIRRLEFTRWDYCESETSAVDQFAALSLSATDMIRGTFSHVIRHYVATTARDGVLLGLRAEESHGRRMSRRLRGSLYRTVDGLWHGQPLADWSGVDVFAFLVSRNLPWFHIYDRDDWQAPHEIRMSWLCNPSFVDRGAAAFLRRYYPQHLAWLAAVNPRVRAYT